MTNVDDRLLLSRVDHAYESYLTDVQFVAGDGTDAITWQIEGWEGIASTAPRLHQGYGSDDEARGKTLDLWTGEIDDWVLGVATDHLGVPSRATSLDVRPNGQPVVSWTVCNGQFGPLHSCAGIEVSGVGHPDDPHAIVTHSCDDVSSLRVGPDDGVYMLSQQLDQSWMLVRRRTLD